MAKTFRVQVKGVRKLLGSLDAKIEQIRRASGAALRIEGEELMTAAKKLTPVDLGTLRASGHVLGPDEKRREQVVTAGFGGPAGTGNLGEQNSEDVGYAVRAHEDVQTFGSSPGGGSRTTGPGAVRKGRRRIFVGQAKYLETPHNARKRGMTARLKRRINRRIG